MKLYVGVTDPDWFHFLKSINPDDVNFWQPGGKTPFKVLDEEAPFLFKLRKPHNAIAGVGFFARHSFLPLNLAWEVFGQKNGCDSLGRFREMIQSNRRDGEMNPTIGCIVLDQPVFFEKEDWISVPTSFSLNIVQGKSYDMGSGDGAMLWEEVSRRLPRYLIDHHPPEDSQSVEPLFAEVNESQSRYGRGWIKIRKGQGSFRIRVTEAYHRRCAMTGERTLPVLEAAHIKDYALNGPNETSNGLLLRSDLHKLFDSGYLTVTSHYKIEVSRRIKEEYENGREYYKLHGKNLMVLPDVKKHYPDRRFLEWHNDSRYRG